MARPTILDDARALFPASYLAKRGVEIVNPHNLTVECVACGRLWSPLLPLRRAWWKCPHYGCNDDALRRERASA